ncbi:MAG TPA: hypothetical protein VMF52_11475 [Steroidobacteraceae bacterium]|nr:hypothetical protein [Steroidobacteraceae bacterium]
MRKLLHVAAAAATTITLTAAAFAQIQASASVYFLDVDPARYAGPAGQRLALQVGDQPRSVALGKQDEICVQLQRSAADGVINARVRALRPEPHEAADVKLAGPGISPGTYRSTPWGMLLRVVPEDSADLDEIKAVGTKDAPVCQL